MLEYGNASFYYTAMYVPVPKETALYRKTITMYFRLKGTIYYIYS